MKAAMKAIGLSAGEPYPPYTGLTREETAALEAVLKSTVLKHRERVHADN
jgi:hypothetical protein